MTDFKWHRRAPRRLDPALAKTTASLARDQEPPKTPGNPGKYAYFQVAVVAERHDRAQVSSGSAAARGERRTPWRYALTLR
jgi:hypothetical protein